MVTAAQRAAINKIQNPELRERIEKLVRESPQEVIQVTSPGGSRFLRVKQQKNVFVSGVRKGLTQEGFSQAEVTQATEFLLEKREAVKRDIEGRQARLKPFEAKQRKEAKAASEARGEITLTRKELAELKGKTSSQRQDALNLLLEKRKLTTERKQRLTKKQDDFIPPKTISTGGVPLTLLGDPRNLEVKARDLSGGFTPRRPIAPQETEVRQPVGIAQLRGETRFGSGAEIQPNIFREQEFDLSGTTPEGLLRTIELGKTFTAERRERTIAAGGVAAFGTQLVFEGIPKAAKAAPEAAAFGALALISPPAAAIVGTAALGLSIPGLQTQIATKGLAGAVATELPSFALFGAAGKGGVKLRTSGIIRKPVSEISFSEFEAKVTDPSFTFDAKPFVIVQEGKTPAFLQRTLKGEIITPRQQDVLLQEVRAAQELPEPTTLKELRFELGRIESRRGITREQARQQDIFRPQTEESLFVEPSREGLVTPGALGGKVRQTQLRESFPTTAQKAAFLLQNIPRQQPKPTVQLSLFPRGKKAQAGLLQQDFNLGEVLRGAGEGIRRSVPRARELPRIAEARIAEARIAEARTGFPLSFSTDIFQGVEQDRITAQRAEQQTGSLLAPIEFQQPRVRQKQPSILDVNILQDQPADIKPIQEVFQDQRQRQRQRQDTALISEQGLEPLLDSPISRFFPDTKPIIERPPTAPKGFLGGLDDISPVGSSPQGFDVIIREKGKDTEFNKKQSFPRQRAKNIGANIVDNSSSASFRIRKSSQPIDSNIDDGLFSLERKFRSPKSKSKLPPKQFIERRRNRIDSAGELAGITAKGLIAKRKKAARENILSGFSGGISL